jgi:hypothetical protein
MVVVFRACGSAIQVLNLWPLKFEFEMRFEFENRSSFGPNSTRPAHRFGPVCLRGAGPELLGTWNRRVKDARRS